MSNTSSNLVRAFATFRTDAAGNRVETLYVVTPSGSVFASNERPFSHNFAAKGTEWHPAESVAVEAEFIGQYARPASLPVEG